jgi:hypothetical protein
LALQIDHRVVLLFLQLRLEGAPLGTRAARPPCLAPAPHRALDDAAHAGHAAHQRREGRLDHPVDHRVGMGGADVLHRRHGVHHVAQRRQLDDQDLQARACPFSAPRRRRWRRA